MLGEEEMEKPKKETERHRERETIWMIISCPRLDNVLVSACQIDAVAVFMPVPTPATIRPTIIWAMEKDDAWIVAPTARMMLPSKIWRGRPIMSPVHIVLSEPTKAPIVYRDEIVPCILVDGLPIVWRKSSLMRTLPKTPCYFEEFSTL